MRKIFALVSIFVCLCLASGQESAHSGMVESCVKWLTSSAKPLPIMQAYTDYERFLKMRRDNPRLLPPALPVGPETTKEELFFSFLHWWLPGNIWHNLMATQYSGAHMLNEYKRRGGKILNLKDMPEPSSRDASLNLPLSLPELPAGHLDYKFKRQAKRDYKTYLRMREKDPGALPPASNATEETRAIDIFYGFLYWWYPENVWHDLIAKDHGRFAARMLETHIRDGYVFPDPPQMHEDDSRDIPSTEFGGDIPLPSRTVDNSPESFALDHAALDIDGSDTGGPNSADNGPEGTP